MKKENLFLAAVLGCLLLFTLIAILRPAKVDLGYSKIYSAQEIKDAAEVVKKQFCEMEGCKLISLNYAGDAACMAEEGYDISYDDALVIQAVFLSPLRPKGGWDAHRIYTWDYILMRRENGPWELLSWGVG